MNRIVFGPSDCGGCAKYRFWTPYGALAAAYPEEYAIVAATSGNQDVNTAYPEYEVHPEWLTSDLIVFQRVVTPRALAAMKRLRSMAPKVRIAYEIDDNLRSLPALNPLVGIFGNCR